MIDLKQVKHAARGFYKHIFKDEHDPEGAQGMFIMMAQTNGAAADVVNFLHRAVVPKQKFGDTSGILGKMSSKRRRDVVQAIRDDGFYVFPELIPDAMLESINRMMDVTPGLLYPAVESGPAKAVHNPQEPLSAAYYYRDTFPPEMQQIMVDETFTSIATDYFGVDPVLHSSQQWTSVSTAEPSSPLAQMYHFDISHLKWLNIFIYLTDVTADTGAHCLIKGSHRVSDKIGAPLRAQGAVRFTDQQIAEAYGTDRHVEIVGKRGTVLCVDTRTCHKGKHPTAGDRRIMANYYVNSTFGIPGETHVVAQPTAEFIAAKNRWPRLLHFYPVGD
ncbi:phytanoyl-CoA dioxygenase family protein [Tardiphaga sp. vice278]|uniref:phytanoyl-CoA dioxygenase family protein n=1 Tax=Tardiphaga sp. vice278 TaxID=2592815 RepID=UPI001163F910|nr:phytanoyl-CoA dioxygenase family protein [Tardiphaga sp. vice278]QDM17958.1 phytanoyl-CoA dioxygenase family protein [Tardiphaga sp. vice278]